MAKYSVIAGATNFTRKQYKADGESIGTFVITISNEIKEKIVDGEDFSSAVEINDLLFLNAVKQKSNLNGWKLSVEVQNGTTILIGKVIGVVHTEEENVPITRATCLMSNGQHFELAVGISGNEIVAQLSGNGLGGSDLPVPTIADVGKYLGVDSEGAYALGYVKTYNKIAKEITSVSGSASFSATSDEWILAMNNDNTLLEIHDTTTSEYYTLWLSTFDATTVRFIGLTKDGKKVEANIVKSGDTYSGTFAISDVGMQVVELSGSSGTLSDSDLAKVSGDNCIIIVNSTYTYYKYSSTPFMLIYVELDFNINETQISYLRIEINKTSKQWNRTWKNQNINQVVANPTLTGNEAELIGLKVGNTKYQAQKLSQTDSITAMYEKPTDFSIEDSYSSYNRCGKELTFVASFSITKTGTPASNEIDVLSFNDIPNSIFTKLVPTQVGNGEYLDQQVLGAFSADYTSVNVQLALAKKSTNIVNLSMDATNLVANTKYHIRYFVKFLLTDNLTKVDSVLGNNSWETIREVCEAGNAGAYWSVGDTKSDLGTDGNTRAFRISHID